MSTPAFLGSSFRFKTDTTVTDVATIITSFRSETVTNGSPVWTEPISQNFKSPVDGSGRFFTVILTRNSATSLNWQVTDQNGVTICTRSIQVAVAGSNVDYYTGQYHAWLNSQQATNEMAAAGILDLSPASQGAWSIYVYGNAFRTSGGAGASDGGFTTTGQLFMLDNGTAANVQRVRGFGFDIATNATAMIDGAGDLISFPSDVEANFAGTRKWAGRPYQVYLVDTSITNGTLKTLSTDTAGATTGTFKVVGMLAGNNMKWAVRQA